MKFILTLLFSSLLVSISEGKDRKILFLGNSYTAQSANFIKEVFNRDGGSYDLKFGTPGGKDLHFHLTNPTKPKSTPFNEMGFCRNPGSKPKARTRRPIYPRLSYCS